MSFFTKFQPSGKVYLLLAVAIFGAANSVTRKLTEIGEQNLIDGRNPISFCNVLFVGNLCALILLIIIYYRQNKLKVFRNINQKQWFTLIIVAILGGVVTPTLIFIALSITSVNNVILIGQFDIPLALFVSVLLFQAKVNKWVIIGAILTTLGVILTVILQPSGIAFQIGKGELLVLIATVSKVSANLISKNTLQQIPLGVFSVFRMLISTIVFFAVVMALYGGEHFVDVASPFLWQWMLIYSAIIVVLGQSLWFNGLKKTTASEVSWASAFNPLVGILSAYLILQEAPTMSQYLGGAVIIMGIIFNQIGVSRLHDYPVKNDIEMSEKVGFKGI